MKEDKMQHRAYQTIAIVELLQAASDYQIVTYAAIYDAIGMSAQRGRGYGFLSTAQGIVLSERGLVFEAVRGVGVCRAKPEDVVDNSGADLMRQKRISRKSMRKLAALSPAEYQSMEPAKQVTHNIRFSLHGLMAELATPKTEKRIEQHALTSSIPPAKMFELWASEEGAS